MDHQSAGERTASSTIALGAAALFIFVATTLGLLAEQTATPTVAPLLLRGTLALKAPTREARRASHMFATIR